MVEPRTWPEPLKPRSSKSFLLKGLPQARSSRNNGCHHTQLVFMSTDESKRQQITKREWIIPLLILTEPFSHKVGVREGAGARGGLSHMR